MSTADDLEHRIEKLHVTTRAGTDEHILDDAFAELERSIREKATTGGQDVLLRTLRNKTKELVAIAVLVLVIFALFISSPSAKAVSLAQIYQAVEKVRNVCIYSFQTGRQEPYQRTWKARFIRVWLIETKKRTVLWDLQNHTKKEIDAINNFTSEAPIQPDMRQKLEDSLINSFGFLPFSDITVVKKDAEWCRVDDNDITATIPEAEVYDLTWTWETDDLVMYYKWRVFVDTTSDLPKRVEWYQKVRNEKEYTLQTIDIVTFPTDDEIKAVIQEKFGEVESNEYNNPETTQINTRIEQ
jgi:hypothetical protein